MAFEDIDFDNNDFEMGPEGTPPPDESGNRTFYIVAGIIGGIMLLALIFMALYAVFFAPQQRNARATEQAKLDAQATQVAMGAEETALAALFTDTPTVTSIPPTETASPSPSPTLIFVSPTNVLVTGTIDRTATVAALLTEAASAQQTATATPSSLPDTGFAEDVGVPVMVGLALVLVVVIFLARRLRTIG